MTMSSYQLDFLKRMKRDKSFIRFVRILVFLLFLTLWEVAARLEWIDSFIFSSPSLIGKTFVNLLLHQQLTAHIAITLTETITSFFLVLLFSTGAAILLWVFPRLAAILEPYFVVLNSLPKSALAPLLIVWLGANMKTIILAGMSVAIFGSILSLFSGFQEIDQDKQMLIKTLGGTKKDVLFKVILPASVPIQLSITKVNIGLCLVGVVIGEFIGAKEGLGYLIIYSSQVFKLTNLILSICILCVIAMGLYAIIGAVEKWYLKKV